MIREIKAIIRPERLPQVLLALHTVPGLPGVTVSTVRGFGRRYPPGAEMAWDEVEMTKLEIVVPTAQAEDVVRLIERGAHTGGVGDGKIFVIPVAGALKIRSGERDGGAL